MHLLMKDCFLCLINHSNTLLLIQQNTQNQKITKHTLNHKNRVPHASIVVAMVTPSTIAKIISGLDHLTGPTTSTTSEDLIFNKTTQTIFSINIILINLVSSHLVLINPVSSHQDPINLTLLTNQCPILIGITTFRLQSMFQFQIIQLLQHTHI